jgi:hypothetical protein
LLRSLPPCASFLYCFLLSFLPCFIGVSFARLLPCFLLLLPFRKKGKKKAMEKVPFLRSFLTDFKRFLLPLIVVEEAAAVRRGPEGGSGRRLEVGGWRLEVGSWTLDVRGQRLQVQVQGSRFKVQGSRFKVQGSRFKVQGSRFKVQGCW